MNVEELNNLLTCIEFPDYLFAVTCDSRGEMYLQAAYMEADIYKPEAGPVLQRTRRWLISPYMTKSEFVQTCLKCVLTSMEHRTREHFRYRGRLVYGPHFDVDRLWEVAAAPLDDRTVK